jgi:ketosteroid isomerase-like protein
MRLGRPACSSMAFAIVDRMIRLASGDEAALEWAAVLIDRDGNRFPIYGVNLVKVKDGKFTHVRAYFDPTQFPQPGSR